MGKVIYEQEEVIDSITFHLALSNLSKKHPEYGGGDTLKAKADKCIPNIKYTSCNHSHRSEKTLNKRHCKISDIISREI